MSCRNWWYFMRFRRWRCNVSLRYRSTSVGHFHRCYVGLHTVVRCESSLAMAGLRNGHWKRWDGDAFAHDIVSRTLSAKLWYCGGFPFFFTFLGLLFFGILFNCCGTCVLIWIGDELIAFQHLNRNFLLDFCLYMLKNHLLHSHETAVDWNYLSTTRGILK